MRKRMITGLVFVALVVVGSVGLGSGAAAGAEPYRVPATVDPTGSRDVTAELLAFFASVPDGSTIEFVPGARYRIDGPLRIEERHGLTFEGRGATFVAVTKADRKRRHWWVIGGSDIVFREVNVVGANPAAGRSDGAYDSEREAQHGFDLSGVQGAELDRVTVQDVYGDFVYLGRAGRGAAVRPARDVWIHDSRFERNGRQGVGLVGIDGAVIERNVITETRRATFDMEPLAGPAYGVRNVRILDNRIGPGRLMFVASKGRGPVDHVLIQGNRLEGKTMNIAIVPPEGVRRSNIRIIGNRSDRTFGTPSGALMTFRRVDDVEVRGNYQPLQRGRNMVAVSAVESCNVVVTDNEIPNGVAQSRIMASRCATSAGR